MSSSRRLWDVRPFVFPSDDNSVGSFGPGLDPSCLLNRLHSELPISTALA